MAFAVKDWKDQPNHTTPITAAALEDLETRTTDYTDDKAVVLNARIDAIDVSGVVAFDPAGDEAITGDWAFETDVTVTPHATGLSRGLLFPSTRANMEVRGAEATHPAPSNEDPLMQIGYNWGSGRDTAEPGFAFVFEGFYIPTVASGDAWGGYNTMELNLDTIIPSFGTVRSFSWRVNTDADSGDQGETEMHLAATSPAGLHFGISKADESRQNFIYKASNEPGRTQIVNRMYGGDGGAFQMGNDGTANSTPHTMGFGPLVLNSDAGALNLGKDAGHSIPGVGIGINPQNLVSDLVIVGAHTEHYVLRLRPIAATTADIMRWEDDAGTTKYGAIDKSGYIVVKKNSAPADAALAANEMAIWYDSTNGAGKFMVKAKQADGTVKTGSFAVNT